MKVFTEFIILHEDIVMPDEENFCPSLWIHNDSDFEGDYYYDGIGGRWTHLEISNKGVVLSVNVYRGQNRNYDPGIFEVKELKRFIGYKESGRYKESENIKNTCVTSFFFETSDVSRYYPEFLETVLYFLNYSDGLIVNCGVLDKNSFRKEFLS